MRRPALLVAACFVVDAAVVVFLGGSIEAAAMFSIFVAFIAVPAIQLLPLPYAILAAVPWFFLRKASGVPLAVDAATAVVLVALVWRRRRFLPQVKLPVVTFLVVPFVFALVWLGWAAPAGHDVRFYGLFGIDFGNLVAVVSTLRVSPLLPLSYVAGGGPLSYHWLYFTIPAALASFGGGAMPNANALILANLLMAMLLVQAVASIASEKLAAAVAVFAPFTTYFYQTISSRVPLGPLAVPMRNHLLLSPLNSMVTFGNNTVALVLAMAALAALERWNRDGKLRDLAEGCIALAAVAGFSITLVFPLALALLAWIPRIRRPAFAVAAAAAAGAIFLAILWTLHVLGGDSSRHLALAFDRGAFLKMALFGMAPLWLLARRRELTIFHAVIAACVAVPSFVYIAGSPTGASDFSMKTATLMAVAFAPLLVVRRSLLVALVVGAGLIQSAAYVLQFPFYRLRHVTTNGVSIERDYANALAWVRGHTPLSAVVADPHELRNRDELFTAILGERRVWLPTAYAKTYLIADLPPAVLARETMPLESGDADVLLVPYAIASPRWRAVHREGSWIVYRRTTT
ncbi:MAG TPA: hypothetical protein VI670_09260 [Thermoanaerobaculia bacterium]